MKTRQAEPWDFDAICELISRYAGEGLLLPRNAEDIRAKLDRFLVLSETRPVGSTDDENFDLTSGEYLIGCVSLEPYGPDLVEVRSLAVTPAARGRGAGGQLLDAALAVAHERGIARLFAVTHAPNLFERHGFSRTSRQAVPEKIERDCVACVHNQDCGLIALLAVVCPDRVLLPVVEFPFEVATAR